MKNIHAMIAVDEKGYGHMIKMLTEEPWIVSAQSAYDPLTKTQYSEAPGLYYARCVASLCKGSTCSCETGDCREHSWEMITGVYKVARKRLSKYDQLAVRTCKNATIDRVARLKKIFKKSRYLQKSYKLSDWQITLWLTDILEQSTRIVYSNADLFRDVEHQQCMANLLSVEKPLERIVLEAIMHKLTFSTTDQLIGYTIPSRWRRT